MQTSATAIVVTQVSSIYGIGILLIEQKEVGGKKELG